MLDHHAVSWDVCKASDVYSIIMLILIFSGWWCWLIKCHCMDLQSLICSYILECHDITWHPKTWLWRRLWSITISCDWSRQSGHWVVWANTKKKHLFSLASVIHSVSDLGPISFHWSARHLSKMCTLSLVHISFINPCLFFRYHYGCVIYGWDPVCKMEESWIQQMNVDRSPGGRNQPFYNVLGDDGSQRYAAHCKLRF